MTAAPVTAHLATKTTIQIHYLNALSAITREIGTMLTTTAAMTMVVAMTMAVAVAMMTKTMTMTMTTTDLDAV